MKTQETAHRMYLLPVLAGLLLTLLGWVWHSKTFSGMAWSGAALAIMLLPLHESTHAAMGKFFRSHLASPWLWLVLSLGLCCMVLWVGIEENGARRYYQDASMRSGLWSLMAFVVFLSLFSQRRPPGMVAYVVLLAGCAALAAGLMAQPDFYSLLLFGMVAVAISLGARNAIRLVVPMAVGAGLMVFLLFVFLSPFRGERIVNTLFSASGVVSASIIPDGWWVVAIVIGIVVILAWLMWVLEGGAATPLQRQLIQAELVFLLLTAGYPLLAKVFHWELAGGVYGLPFFTPGGASLASALLLVATAPNPAESRSRAVRAVGF